MDKYNKIVAAKWLHQNAQAVGAWSSQVTEILTKTNTFYTRDELKQILNDTVSKLTPRATGGRVQSSVPQEKDVQDEIVNRVEQAIIDNSHSKQFQDSVRYTTDQMILAEQAISVTASRLTKSDSAGQPFADSADLTSSFEALDKVLFVASGGVYGLEPQRRGILEDLLKPGNLRLINGPPGSGKSTLIQGLMFCMSKHAIDNNESIPSFYATAPSAKAAATIVEEVNMIKEFAGQGGLESDFIHRIPAVQGAETLDDMINKMNNGEVPKGAFMMIDEAGLMGSMQCADLLEAAEKTGVRLFMFGDNLQIPPKTAGNGFDQLLQNQAELGLDVMYLSAVLRQRTKNEAQWTMDIRSGEPMKALEGYAARRYTRPDPNGKLKISDAPDADGDAGLVMQDDATGVYQQLTSDLIKYKQENPRRDFVVMGTDDQSAENLNDFIRKEMIAAGLIKNLKTYQVDDKAMEIGKGDMLMLTAPIVLGGETGVLHAGAQLKVREVGEDKIRVRTAVGKFDVSAASVVKNAKYGFALPLYQAQGQSKYRAFLAIDKAGSMDKVYGGVAFSRHERQMSAYVSKQAYPTLSALANEMSVFRTRKALISDGLGKGIEQIPLKHTEEKVINAMRNLYQEGR